MAVTANKHTHLSFDKKGLQRITSILWKNVNISSFIFSPNWAKWHFWMAHKISKGPYKIAMSECFILAPCFYMSPSGTSHVCLWIFRERFQQLHSCEMFWFHWITAFYQTSFLRENFQQVLLLVPKHSLLKFIEHFLLYFFWNPIIFVNLVLGYDLGCFSS